MRELIVFICLILSFTACGKPIQDYELIPRDSIQSDPYRVARLYLFGQLHNNNGVVTDVYCGDKYDAEDGVCPTCIPNPQLVNCEHTWPQSKFGRDQVESKKIDLHHLFPSTSFANSARSNLPFGEVNGKVICGRSRKGIIIGTNILGFEPPDSHKGNVARAMFYFSVVYRMSIDPIQEVYFRRWHVLDPVNAQEYNRNLKIKAIQGNTNPFIDDPRLVESIDDF